MEEYCPFLETEPRRQGDWPYRCAIGVNFYSVGPERELCRICPVAHLGDALLCEHLDVYTFLQVNRERKRSVQVEMECRLGADPLPDPVRCDICGLLGPHTPRDLKHLHQCRKEANNHERNAKLRSGSFAYIGENPSES